MSTIDLRGAGGPGFAVVAAARDAVVRYRMLHTGDRVVVGISGGPDSTCLADVLRRLAGPLRLQLVLAHVDHGLAPHSAEVARRVADQAEAWGLPLRMMTAEGLEGPNLQARARALRYGFFAEVADDTGASRIATGHTLDDRVETTLARLVHGAGTAGLAGIPPARGRRIRPLCDVRRADTIAYCKDTGLSYFLDPANDDPRFERAAVRHELVAAIERRWGPGAIRAMAASAQRLREDADALDAVAADVAGAILSSGPHGVRCDRPALEALPRALRRRVLERALGRVRDRHKAIDAVLDALERAPAPGWRMDAAVGTVTIERDAVIVGPRRAAAQHDPGDAEPFEAG